MSSALGQRSTVRYYIIIIVSSSSSIGGGSSSSGSGSSNGSSSSRSRRSSSSSSKSLKCRDLSRETSNSRFQFPTARDSHSHFQLPGDMQQARRVLRGPK